MNHTPFCRFGSSELTAAILFLCANIGPAREVPASNFRAVEIDNKIEIGYGLAIADVDGDKKLDILLADKQQIVWYRNPGWEKYVIAENLTKADNVCIAATDIDGDGKAEIAVGAGWNPNDTLNSGAVFYLIAPKDRTQKWEAVELPHEPTVHRMHWLRNSSGKFDLVVAPLHGRGNRNGEGEGVKILSYKMPADPHDPWKTESLNYSLPLERTSMPLHMTHNFDPMKWSRQPGDEMLVAAREGIFHFVPEEGGWKGWQLAANNASETNFAGAGEVRAAKLAGQNKIVATIEPMHGNQVVVYTAPLAIDSIPRWRRNVLDASLKEGHALACGDLLGIGSDQLVVGWRAKNSDGKVGVKLFIPLDNSAKNWKQALVDDNAMACEDLRLADLDGDGKLDIVAAGRATKNLKVYFNTTGK